VPEFAAPVENLSASINPKLHSFDPAAPRELVRQYDPADTNQDRADQRKSSRLLRAATLTGVGGRKYAAAEPRIAFTGSMSSPKQLGMVGTGGCR
jgi:hypothetical protein